MAYEQRQRHLIHCMNELMHPRAIKQSRTVNENAQRELWKLRLNRLKGISNALFRRCITWKSRGLLILKTGHERIKELRSLHCRPSL
jgi:hypothetical protein